MEGNGFKQIVCKIKLKKFMPKTASSADTSCRHANRDLPILLLFLCSFSLAFLGDDISSHRFCLYSVFTLNPPAKPLSSWETSEWLLLTLIISFL